MQTFRNAFMSMSFLSRFAIEYKLIGQIMLETMLIPQADLFW